jgi:crossover junction endodeoxyribonuclease RusA
MSTFAITVFGSPQPKQRARKGKGNRHYTPAETVRYERSVRSIAQLVIAPSWRKDGIYSLHVEAHFADRRARDIDNVIKAVSDALNGVAFDDDSQVTEVSGRKHLGSTEPRTVITVTWLGEREVKRRKVRSA